MSTTLLHQQMVNSSARPRKTVVTFLSSFSSNAYCILVLLPSEKNTWQLLILYHCTYEQVWFWELFSMEVIRRKWPNFLRASRSKNCIHFVSKSVHSLFWVRFSWKLFITRKHSQTVEINYFRHNTISAINEKNDTSRKLW